MTFNFRIWRKREKMIKDGALQETGIFLLSADEVREAKNRKPNWGQSRSLSVAYGEFQSYRTARSIALLQLIFPKNKWKIK